MSDTKEIARFEALAEQAYTTMYDTRDHSVKDCIDDALYNLGRARDIAQMRGLKDDIVRLTRRMAHIQAVYESQFRKR
jgi:hypothetical protein